MPNLHLSCKITTDCFFVANGYSTEQVIEVLFFYKDVVKRPVKVFVNLNADALLEDLQAELGAKVKVHPAGKQIISMCSFIFFTVA